MTVDVVVDIFNRVNSGGTKLSKGDLALARICAIRPAAREELRTAIATWQAAGFDLSLDWFLRCVNVVVTGEARFGAMQERLRRGLRRRAQEGRLRPSTSCSTFSRPASDSTTTAS